MALPTVRRKRCASPRIYSRRGQPEAQETYVHNVMAPALYHFHPSQSHPTFLKPFLLPNQTLHRLRHSPLITLTQALIPTDFRIFPLPLLHQRLQLCIIILRHRLRRHLSHTPPPIPPNILLNSSNRPLQRRDTHALLQALAREHVQGGRHEFDFDGGVRG